MLVQRALQPGTTYGAGILMSDATQLTMFSGDVSAHGVYMSLANIDKSKSKWDKTLSGLPNLSQDRRTSLVHLLNRRLFHRCMEVITRPFRRTKPHEALDPTGNKSSATLPLSPVTSAHNAKQAGKSLEIVGTTPRGHQRALWSG